MVNKSNTEEEFNQLRLLVDTSSLEQNVALLNKLHSEKSWINASVVAMSVSKRMMLVGTSYFVRGMKELKEQISEEEDPDDNY